MEEKRSKFVAPTSQRSYINDATKAAIHPVRVQILKALKEGSKSTVELETLTGQARHNLYHHLNALEQVDLVAWSMRDNKTKLYHLKVPKSPEAAVVVLTKEDIEKKPAEFKALIDALAAMEGEEIPNSGEIARAEICLYYSRHGE